MMFATNLHMEKLTDIAWHQLSVEETAGLPGERPGRLPGLKAP